MTREHYVDSDFDSSGYGLIDLGPAAPDKSRERWLFLWVILQALADVGILQHGNRMFAAGRAEFEAKVARNWFLNNNKDYPLVCELAGNPRRISQEAFNRLKKSLSENGYHQRIIVTKDLRVIGGHQRIKALKEIGLKGVPRRPSLFREG
jgi:hypothetical protein